MTPVYFINLNALFPPIMAVQKCYPKLIQNTRLKSRE